MILMALHDHVRKLTYNDYALIPEDGQRHEIIDGEHYMTPSPMTLHQRTVLRLTLRLGGFVELHGLGEVFVAPYDVVFSKHDIVQPDLLFISRKRAAIVTPKNVQGAPDLVIEILSESTRRLDEKVKLDLYERSDVLEYWMFNPFRKTVRAFCRIGPSLRLVAELSAEASDALTTPLLPGFGLPLSELFAI
jgi:Uma2 family endonuclease